MILIIYFLVYYFSETILNLFLLNHFSFCVLIYEKESLATAPNAILRLKPTDLSSSNTRTTNVSTRNSLQHTLKTLLQKLRIKLNSTKWELCCEKTRLSLCPCSCIPGIKRKRTNFFSWIVNESCDLENKQPASLEY